MPKKTSYASDLLGLSRLTIDAVAGISDLAQSLHMQILNQGVARGTPLLKPIAGVTHLVYRSVHGVTRLVGGSIERVLAPLTPLLGQNWSGRDALLAAVNGVLGDHLESSKNPLAIPMQLRIAGHALTLTPAALAQALPAALPRVHGRILVLAHGLCMNDLQWLRAGTDHGANLMLERGYCSLYLHYNTGRHISSNGAQFAHTLQAMCDAWPVPVEEIVILGHSMGGLITRSACHIAQQAKLGWLSKLSKIVFLGSPHQGAPLERGGNWVNILTDANAYSAPFSRLAKIRSAGITDLRHGSLLASDWQDKDRFAHSSTLPGTVPLPKNVACFAIAATLGKRIGDISDISLGDGLVPLASALGQHTLPERRLDFATERQAIVYQTNHLDLLNSPMVTQLLLAWL